MRALILVAVAALAVSACSKKEAAENTMNVDETLTTENVVANDTMAIDAANGMDANMTMDANVAVDANAVDANAVDANTTNAMYSLSAGRLRRVERGGAAGFPAAPFS